MLKVNSADRNPFVILFLKRVITCDESASKDNISQLLYRQLSLLKNIHKFKFKWLIFHDSNFNALFTRIFIIFSKYYVISILRKYSRNIYYFTNFLHFRDFVINTLLISKVGHILICHGYHPFLKYSPYV